MKQLVIIALFLALGPSSVIAEKVAQSVPSKEEAIAAIEALTVRPTDKAAKAHASSILAFAEGSHAVRVDLNIEYLPWVTREEKIENADILVGAFVGGDLLPQLKTGAKQDHTKEGLLAMLDTYSTLRKKGAIVKIKELDQWGTMTDEQLDGFIAEVAERAQPLMQPPMQASNVERANVTLYQPDKVLRERKVEPADLAGYIKALTDVLTKELSASKVPETLDIAVIVRPGQQSKAWFVSSLENPPRRENLAALLEKVKPIDVAGGPFAFAISLNIAGAKRPVPQDGDFKPPMPKEWIEAAKKAGSGTVIPEGIVEALWNMGEPTIEKAEQPADGKTPKAPQPPN